MSRGWDFYPCEVEGRPASIFVDLDVPTADDRLGWFCYVRVYMREPCENGLSSQDEFKTLCAIEERFERELVDDSSRYVGRNTCGGCRDFYFYLSDAAAWEDRVARSMAHYADYRFDTGARPDPAWETYYGFLQPNRDQLRWIMDRRVCEQLEEGGDIPSVPRDVDHWAYFSNPHSAEAFIAQASAEGYFERGPPEATDDGRWCAWIFRSQASDLDAINASTSFLMRAAEAHGGEYDGFETSVEKSSLAV